MSNVRSGRSIDSALRKKGFLRDSDGDHVNYYFLRQTGERTSIKTKMSHGMLGSTIDVNILSKMAHQLHLTKKRFLDFIDCLLDEEEYRQVLRDAGFEV
jgi:hypothetical protein